MNTVLADLEREVEQRLRSWQETEAAARLWDRDATLFSADPAVQEKVANRLGWLGAVEFAQPRLAELQSFVRLMREEGFSRALLVGMGGSSLAPEVFRTVFGVAPGGLDLRIADSTHPGAVRDATEWAGQKPLVLIASKSGGTAEVAALQAFLADRHDPSRSFVAITDPGTLLERTAADTPYRRCFRNPADVGGRFSALTWFGLVPAALVGVNVEALLEHTAAMAQRCGSGVPARDNPGLRLGAFLGEAAGLGRNKLTLLFSPRIAHFGHWIEQLVAESTGKQSKGILPVHEEPALELDHYSDDRVFVATVLRGDHDDQLRAQCEELAGAGHPVCVLEMETLLHLGAEMLRWEIATAMAGVALGIDPFDEPNVTESKDLTKALLGDHQRSGALPEPKPILEEGGITLSADAEFEAAQAEGSLSAMLAAHLGRARAGDYFAILAYLPDDGEIADELRLLRQVCAERTRLPTTLGFGPRFLHSTGQLHKGGPDQGLFLQITERGNDALPIPGADHGFETLIAAQALGDLQALLRRGRRVVRVQLERADSSALRALTEAVRESSAG